MTSSLISNPPHKKHRISQIIPSYRTSKSEEQKGVEFEESPKVDKIIRECLDIFQNVR